MNATIEDRARMVVAIWKEGSLSAAATRLGTSAATVTRKLQALEEELGVVLFERNTRSLRVTPAGDELAMRLERGLEEIDGAVHALLQRDEGVRGWVRISVPPNLSPILGPMLLRFRTLHPEVQLRVHTSERRLTYAREDVDLLLRVGRLEEEGLVAKPLTRYRHMLCGHKSLRRKLRRPSDLARVDVATWASSGPPAPWKLTRDTEVARVTPSPVLVSNDYDLLAYSIRHSPMVCELPALLATPLLETGEVVRVLPKWVLPEVNLTLLYPAHRLLPSGVRALIRHLQTEFND